MEDEFVIDKEIKQFICKLYNNKYFMPNQNSFLGRFDILAYPVVMEIFYYPMTNEVHDVELDCYWADLLETREDRIKFTNERLPAYLQGLCSQIKMKKYKMWVRYDDDVPNSCTIKFYKKTSEKLQ